MINKTEDCDVLHFSVSFDLFIYFFLLQLPCLQFPYLTKISEFYLTNRIGFDLHNVKGNWTRMDENLGLANCYFHIMLGRPTSLSNSGQMKCSNQ